MNEECEVVRDLMPLVIDEVASNGSKRMVDRHLERCAECTAYMKQLKTSLPSEKAEETQADCAAFRAATIKLRKLKRFRTLRNILMGALIVCIFALGGLWGYNQLRRMTKPMPTEDYDILLSQLKDGSLVVSFDYHESREYLGSTMMTATEKNQTTGDIAAILYIGVEKYVLPMKMADPMQNGSGMRLPSEWQTSYAEIRKGTPSDYQVLWKQEDGERMIAEASPEMENYYAWWDVIDQLESRMLATKDGKAVFGDSTDSKRYSMAMHQADALATLVPEWQPRVMPQFLLLDQDTIQWILEGVERDPSESLSGSGAPMQGIPD